MRVSVVSVLSLAVAALLAACKESAEKKGAPGNGTPTIASNPPAPKAGACQLLTRSELGEAIAKPVIREEERSPKRCVFYTDDPVVYVDLEIDRENAAEAWQGVSAGNTLIGAASEGLAGLGEQAFFGPRDRLYVLDKGTFVAVEAGFDAEVRDRAKRVAALVFGKLP